MGLMAVGDNNKLYGEVQSMNRKNQQKQALEREQVETAPQTIVPKFVPNWTQPIRFDRIVLNVSDCEYEVVPKVAKELKWKVKTDQNNPEWDLWWTDWAVAPEVLMRMEHHQKINHFPGMYTLSRKNLLAKNLMKMRRKNAQEYNYFPLTWNLPGDYQELKTYFQNKPKGKARTYIVKPECLSQGKGIFLTRKLQDIVAGQHCVVQRYLSRPYLIEGLKFDLRIYVLVAGVDPLRLFIFRQGLARFATETYVAPNRENMEDVCMHLTNYAINKESDKFIFNQDEHDMGIGHKRNLEAVFKIMQEKGADVQTLWLKIQDLIVKTIISGNSHLKFQYRSCQPENFRGDMCFELLGFDVIITDDLQPVLLEINYTPSFSTDTPLDWNIKHSLIHDSLVIMGLKKEFKEETVKVRKECRDLRMMTGKKNKLTPEEREERRRECVKQRDQYMSNNLGGFTQIYPLPPDHPRQAAYEKLIQLEAESSGEVKKIKPEQPAIARRNTEKLSKLPIISKECPEPKEQIKRLALSKKNAELIKTTQLTKGSKAEVQDQNTRVQGGEEERGSLQGRDFSQRVIKKMRLREMSTNPKKKSMQVRETLVPKTIQFQGTRLDGVSEGYRLQLNRGQQYRLQLNRGQE